MANVALFRAGQTPQYLTSVHTPLYESDPDAIINPDVTAVAAVALQYWKRSGNSVLEMTAGEKTAVDAALAAARLASRRAGAELSQSSADVEGTRLRALILVLLDEINTLRSAQGSPVVGIATAVWDPANLANAGGTSSQGITVAGVAFGDVVDVGAPYSLQGLLATGSVLTAGPTGTVVIRLHNNTGGAINLASGTWTVVVRRPAAMNPRTLTQARTAYTNKIQAGDAD